jgi:pyruvate formate lyase activating enzyme
MQSGAVFDIREFAVHDGPGMRTTVFMKGCPLRCSWCHNPEGISPEPQTMTGSAGTRVVGRQYTSAELAALLNKQSDILRANEGGVTFSGGEPLMQAAFVTEVIEQLDRTHVVLDTSGFGRGEDFRLLASRVDLVFFDLKLMDPEEHRQHTGRENAPTLRNLRLLSTLAVPFVIRVPLVPGITDTERNLAAIAQAIRGLPRLIRVDLLPYNRAAGGKYAPCGMEFRPRVDESRPVNANTAVFEAAGVRATVV